MRLGNHKGGSFQRMERTNDMANDPESWACVDCGFNTAPGLPTRGQMEQAFTSIKRENATINARFDANSEVYIVTSKVWKAAGMEDFGGCLCIGCLEKRLGRRLVPKDFPEHEFNKMPGTERLLDRREGGGWLRYARNHPVRG
jgi:hypothetical protein